MSIQHAWRIKKLEKKVESLEDEVASLRALVTPLEKPAPPPMRRGPGRPPKNRQDNAHTN